MVNPYVGGGGIRGGFGERVEFSHMYYVYIHKKNYEWACKVIRNNKLVAAICFGPQFLGRAGILKDFKFTTSCSINKIRQLGLKDPFVRENYELKRVVIDRNLITAQGYAFIDFAIVVCDYLEVFETITQKEEQMGRVYETFKGYSTLKLAEDNGVI